MGRLLAENERKNPDMIRIRKTLNPSSKDSIHNLNQNENTKANEGGLKDVDEENDQLHQGIWYYNQLSVIINYDITSR